MKNRNKMIRLCFAGEIILLGLILVLVAIRIGNLTKVSAQKSAQAASSGVADTASGSVKSAADDSREKTDNLNNVLGSAAESETVPVYAGAASAGTSSDVTVPADASQGSTASAVSAQPTAANHYLTDISGLDAGYVFTEGQFDASNTAQYFTASPISDTVYARIIGKSYRENNDISLDQLRYLKVVHYNFDHQVQVGEIIVNAALASDFLSVFQELFADNYEIRQMHLVDNYWTGDPITTDTASIDKDNTSAFNYRTATNSSKLSNHAFGCAVDLNPLENPYVSFSDSGAAHTYHENAQQYKDNRTSDEPHVITHEDIAYQVFINHGFEWGGDWGNPKDYQHFDKAVS